MQCIEAGHKGRVKGGTCRQGIKVQREGMVGRGGAGASGGALGGCMTGCNNCTGCQLVDDGSLLRLKIEVKQG